MADEGRFRATDLMLSLDNGYLIVGCGADTGTIDMAGERCGQNTAREFALSVTPGNRGHLIAAMREAIRNLETSERVRQETDSKAG